MKNERNLSIIGAAGLVVQFLTVIVSCLTCKERNINGLLSAISAIGSIFGAFVLYREVVAPKVTKIIDKITEIDDIEDDDELLSFDDFWTKDEAEE